MSSAMSSAAVWMAARGRDTSDDGALEGSLRPISPGGSIGLVSRRQRLRFFQSARISVAAFAPGAPVIPPPG